MILFQSTDATSVLCVCAGEYKAGGFTLLNVGCQKGMHKDNAEQNCTWPFISCREWCCECVGVDGAVEGGDAMT